VSPLQHGERELSLFVHLTRMVGLLTLLGGIILMVAANAVIGVAIVLLSALYFALAEIIRYLALIAYRAEGRQLLFRNESEQLETEVDVAI
jgi:hypothetical protein